jgi:FdrA protein
MKPAEELAPVIKKAKHLAENGKRHLSIICSVTGTDGDPQNRNNVEEKLKDAGAIVMPTNAAASELSGYIVSMLGSE